MISTEKIKLTPLEGTFARWGIPEGALFYCEDDLREDSPHASGIRLWHVVERRGRKIRFELKAQIDNSSGRLPNRRPRMRAYFLVYYKGKRKCLARSHVAYLAYYRMPWLPGYVLDHLFNPGNDPNSTLNDNPRNLEAVSPSENCRRSEAFRQHALKNIERMHRARAEKRRREREEREKNAETQDQKTAK